MMSYKKWKPVDDLDGSFYLEGLYDDYEGFRLLLKSEKTERMLRIAFDSALSYRNVDEGDLLKSSGKISGGFFQVEDSSYLKWFNDESFDTWKDKKIIHYAIYTPNDCVDILSAISPKVEWLND